MSKRKKEKWIQGVIREEGALRREVRRRYGKRGFTKRGTIKVSVLQELSKSKNKRTGKDTRTAKRARLALNLRKMH